MATIQILFLLVSTAFSAVNDEDYYARLNEQSTQLAKTADFQKRYPVKLNLSPALLDNIGRKLVNNETGCSKEGLVAWPKQDNRDRGEEFPSLGLGHAVWFPAGVEKRVDESFPKMIAYLRAQKIKVPSWLDKDDIGPAPWANRQAFVNDTVRPQELRNFLSRPDVIKGQIKFYVNRLETAIPNILADAELRGNKAEAQRIYANFLRMAETDFGIRAMVDYVNFKGEGLIFKERTDTLQRHWGLKQVLANIPANAPNVNDAFADSAYQMLKRIPDDALPQRRPIREQYLAGGWSRRINETYRSGRMDLVNCPVIADARLSTVPVAPAAPSAPSITIGEGNSNFFGTAIGR